MNSAHHENCRDNRDISAFWSALWLLNWMKWYNMYNFVKMWWSSVDSGELQWTPVDSGDTFVSPLSFLWVFHRSPLESTGVHWSSLESSDIKGGVVKYCAGVWVQVRFLQPSPYPYPRCGLAGTRQVDGQVFFFFGVWTEINCDEHAWSLFYHYHHFLWAQQMWKDALKGKSIRLQPSYNICANLFHSF